MKKIVLFLIFGLISLYAKPCMTDIYFGNGVWNTEKEAINSKRALKRFMQYQAVTQLDPQKEGETYRFGHAYNPSRGTVDDLIETFWQLKESGQITDGYFLAVYSALAAESNGEEFLQKLQTIISNYNGDVNAMYQLYTNASFSKKHNVLLVAHSQGNLFGNKMYTLMSDAQKNKFRMVSVATPADSVAGGGPYVTASGDYVINSIPNVLPSNVDGFGHTFIGTYLNGSINAPRKIALYVKSAYDNLSQSSTCGGYDQIFMHMYGLNYIKVYGTPSGTYATVELGTVSLDMYDPPIKVVIPDVPEDRVIYVCSQPSIFYGDLDLFSGSYGNDSLSYKPGTIYDKETLEGREGLSYTITSSDGKKCADVSFTGELYDLALSAFD